MEAQLKTVLGQTHFSMGSPEGYPIICNLMVLLEGRIVGEVTDCF